MRCGLDEAGRGPLAGPVCAAAVVLPQDFPIEVLGDSKKLSLAQREKARIIIYEEAIAWGIGWASAAEIDKINILQASLLAMERAFYAMLSYAASLNRSLDISEAVADGLYTPHIPVPCSALVKADGSVPEVMAASILAKTARDRMMERYGWIYPEYGFEQHKGYPTKLHRSRILQYGPSPIQRFSFSIGPEQALFDF
ncbi:ribonuclease HII [Gracilinema caldarium]|uniref:ribonuclease HII n=1 Tax=Gracilinema caldarium TaxID=215591 RepID=UPI0026ECBF5D|nr:ribonuclease HII [Gracilinema caldarium]